MCRADREVREQRLGSSSNNWEQADTCGLPAKQAECESEFTPPCLTQLQHLSKVRHSFVHTCGLVLRTYNDSTGAETAAKRKRTAQSLLQFAISPPPLRFVGAMIASKKPSAMV